MELVYAILLFRKASALPEFAVIKSMVAFWSFLENPALATLSLLLSNLFSVVLITNILLSCFNDIVLPFSTLSIQEQFEYVEQRLRNAIELQCQLL